MSLEDFSIEWKHQDGQQIIFFYHLDAWFYVVPGKPEQRIYIGQDEAFNIEVLEEKYGCRYLFDAYISAFDKKCAIYAES